MKLNAAQKAVIRQVYGGSVDIKKTIRDIEKNARHRMPSYAEWMPSDEYPNSIGLYVSDEEQGSLMYQNGRWVAWAGNKKLGSYETANAAAFALREDLGLI